MKTSINLFTALLLMVLLGCQKSLTTDALKVENQTISVYQKQMLDELNFARTNPIGYSDTRLKTAFNDGSDNGSYTYMRTFVPVGSLSFDNALNIAASTYAQFLAEKNLMGHNENGTPLKRAITVGYTGSSIGENIAASTSEAYNGIADPTLAATNFVRILIIDAGVADLGHRTTMLNKLYTKVGIGYSHNLSSTFVNYTVQDYGVGL
ncbi:MAG: CAP domain-containing protein [Bacteroidia bacterium]|nr:CAP domain-containing protein [Bacteroidia bacterium]